MLVDAVLFHRRVAQDVVDETLGIFVLVHLDVQCGDDAPPKDPKKDAQEEEKVLVVTKQRWVFLVWNGVRRRNREV